MTSHRPTVLVVDDEFIIANSLSLQVEEMGYSVCGVAGTAREAGNKPIDKSSNAIVESRQKVFQQPEIIDWKEQRNLSLDQSKGILGR